MEKIRLSHLTRLIQTTVDQRFAGEMFCITAQITDVRRQSGLRRCYLKFIEKESWGITAEIRGVFWSDHFDEIERFESATGQAFADGIEITCTVAVKFHSRYGLTLDVTAIDVAYALGALELERQNTFARLVRENPHNIALVDGAYRTKNNGLPLPPVIQHIALITAPNSDGQRDFMQEITHNRHGYAFDVTQFGVTIQGDYAPVLILDQLRSVWRSTLR